MDSPRDASRKLEVPDTEATTAFHRVTVAAPAAPQIPVAAAARIPVPRDLASTLLPGERVTFGSSPHPIVLIRPLVVLALVVVAFGVAWNTVPFTFRPYVEALSAVAAIASVWSFLRDATYYVGVRAVATNRRIFIIRGVLRRRVAPLGNTALAGSTLVQGVLGRMYGFGSVDIPQSGTHRALFRDMREAGALYRECQAVANGVDGDTWTPAVRQTIIP